MRKHSSIITTLPKNSFEELIKNSNSVSEIMRHFGLECDGANFRQFYKRAEKENLLNEIEKLKIRSKKNHNPVWNKHTKESFLELLKTNTTMSSAKIKKYLFKFDIIENKCSLCPQGPTWNNKKLSLQLDHIDGNRHNNMLENFRIVCPNCHSQTETYAGKRHKKQNNCQECGKVCSKQANLCLKCSSKNKIVQCVSTRKFEVSKEELSRLVDTMPMTKIGEIFGVTDNSIRKRCLILGIELKPKKARKSNQSLTITETAL